ncbi:2-polyprenyl-3-methyl-5-hydroxy-6-metoxy-1,4-benzoquinol methylase [Paucibacter oligotrophus]|uniref:2-polyprenyl-3-methyl-5-hydroxy-6-metoxy-1, 4-benzoquinol methylase n=1 Tax=Roseateles oligotrophus TaxID=1769250 RepID=A0A840L5Z2_9BURK|nr:class I SAM-dependent methyltransferase [Roseateles oligotrophus]MBB4843211.1 2-polyprenyl-3-methyl-5-hydroxy-6-metoxy-1,4-benzoquinol methylase [Roseateles oligotrophus]
MMVTSPTFNPVQDQQLVERARRFGRHIGGYSRSGVLIAAYKLGIFARLSHSSLNRQALAAALEVDQTGISLVVDTLIAMGYVTECGETDAVSIHPDWREAFTEGPCSLLADLEAAEMASRVWNSLADVISRKQETEEAYRQSLFEGRCHEYRALQAYNRLQANQVIAAVLPLLVNANQILDIAGADGYIADEILRRTETPTITIVDLGKANSKCKEIFAGHVQSGRLKTVNQDVRDLALGKRFDVVLMTEVTELFDVSEKRKVLQRALDHVQENGTLIVTKLSMPKIGGSEALSIFSLKMYIKGNGSYLETDCELAGLIAELQIQHQQQVIADKVVFVCQRRGASQAK